MVLMRARRNEVRTGYAYATEDEAGDESEVEGLEGVSTLLVFPFTPPSVSETGLDL